MRREAAAVSVDRRAFLKTSGAALLLPLSPAGFSEGPISHRLRPPDAGWPSKEAWKQLKDAVGGNLIPVEFPLTACASAPDSVECKTLFENLKNPYYIGDQPGLTQTLGWVERMGHKAKHLRGSCKKCPGHCRGRQLCT